MVLYERGGVWNRAWNESHLHGTWPVKIRGTMGPQARKSAQTRREVARRPDATEKGEWRKEGREGREGKRVVAVVEAAQSFEIL